MSSPDKDATKDTLGRLKSFGVAEPWQALLLAPNRYESLAHVVRDSASLHTPTPEDTLTDSGSVERAAVLVGVISRPAEYDPIKKRSNLSIQLQDGTQVRALTFGHPDQLPGDWRRAGATASMQGKILLGGNGFTLLVGPRPIPEECLGHAVGVYPGKSRVIKPETVRDRVLALITRDHLARAADAVGSAVFPFTPREVLDAWSDTHGYRRLNESAIARAVHRLHMPVSPTQGEAAKQLLSDLSALALIVKAERERPRVGTFQRVIISSGALAARMRTIHHTPTKEQQVAVKEALDDMASGRPMHRLLSGDVGTGKTTVFALLAAVIYDAGGEVGIMLPSEDMVQQVSREMQAWWPDIDVSKITGASKDASRHRMRIGTTAMISRKEADWSPTLMIVDEQQKYASHQREALTRQGGHLLEATATCLPRTMAQLQFGLVPVSRLTQAHTPKHVATELWDSAGADQKRALFEEVKRTLAEDAQVLVIYAARDSKQARSIATEDAGQTGGDPQAAITPLEEGVERWRRVLGEGEVAMLHGKMKAAEREENLSRIRSGEARVLCATTAAEVGLNLPRLRHAIITNPDRFGLVTLHQIRGRLARTGGWGRCDLLGDLQQLSEGSLERLSALVNETDGFALADFDMRHRGMGSLQSSESRQSGDGDAGLLVGDKPGISHFETAHQMLTALPSIEEALTRRESPGATEEASLSNSPPAPAP